MSEIKPWEDRLPSMGGNESDEMRSMQDEITELRARVAELEKDGCGSFIPTHRHYKGGLYRALREAMMEDDLRPMAVYEDAMGCVWVRPMAEFLDKFESIDTDANQPCQT